MLPEDIDINNNSEIWDQIRDLFLNEITSIPHSSQYPQYLNKIVAIYRHLNPYISQSVISFSLKILNILWESEKMNQDTFISFHKIAQCNESELFTRDIEEKLSSNLVRNLVALRKKYTQFSSKVLISTLFEDFLNYLLILPYNQVLEAIKRSSSLGHFHSYVNSHVKTQNKQLKGRYYTSSDIAQFITEKTLDSVNPDSSTKILDLCAGTGVFTMEICNKLLSQSMNNASVSNPLLILQNIVENNIHTIDVDPIATYILRIRLILKYLEYNPDLAQLNSFITALLKATKIGNALDGNDYFHIKFDAIISNPPYVSEKSNKQYIDSMVTNRNTSFYKPRLDYYLHFLAFALENVKETGKFGFIIPSYFIDTKSATSIRKFLYDHISHIDFYDYHDKVLFSNAPGFHSCVIVGHLKPNEQFQSEFLDYYDQTQRKTKSIPYSEVFLDDFGYMMKFTPKPDFHYLNNFETTLSDMSEIRQGIVAGPDRVRKRHLEFVNNPKITVNQGVFVLSNHEVEKLHLESREKKVLHPFCYVRDLDKEFYSKSELTQLENQIIYLNQESVKETNFPNLIEYLKQFKPIMNARRETQLRKRRWYELHWPRTIDIFTAPRILAIRRAFTPRFIYTEIPFVTDLATNIIIPRDPNACRKLFEHLISPEITEWIAFYSKKKGGMLQIDKSVLERIPVPKEF